MAYSATTQTRLAHPATLRRFRTRPALEFIQATRRPLYCGEFGVIDRAPRESAHRWYRDFLGLMRDYKIGRAAWSYKLMDFGLVDRDGRVVDEELLKIVTQK